MSTPSTMGWEEAKKRAQILSAIRVFFEKRNVIEVDTPLLASATVTDVHLDAFITQYDYMPDSEESTPLYAQTSPEFAMKRLLASGYGCCYQICKAFRHEQHGRFHNPEFTILEWYRLNYDLFQLMDEVNELLRAVLPSKDAKKITYQNLFIQEINIDPLIATKKELIQLIDSHEMLSDWLIKEEIDTLLQFIMSEIIEPKIGIERPYFVYDFPASQASLAKLNSEDNRVAQRFECYYQGIELANGFNELTDATEQLNRFDKDNEERIRHGKSVNAVDQKFIAALRAGLPDCAGVALGIDRLLMLAMDANCIDQVISFPIREA